MNAIARRYRLPSIAFVLATIAIGCANSAFGRDLPLKMATFTVSVDAQQRFFEQIRQFASRTGFETKIVRIQEGSERFAIILTRDNLLIAGDNSSLDPGGQSFRVERFEIGVYPYGMGTIPRSEAAELAGDFARTVVKAEGVTLSGMR